MENADVHRKYMARCLELALGGQGNVAPNPMVGAVIVHNNQIIGEGFHAMYGQAHAEVNAINSVQIKNFLRIDPIRFAEPVRITAKLRHVPIGLSNTKFPV